MSYVRKAITSNEKLLCISRVHWIYLLEGLFWLITLTLAGLAADYYLYLYFGTHAIHFTVDLAWLHFDEKNTPIPWVLGATGLALFWTCFMEYISVEIGVTDQRIIYKKGLIFIEIQQVDLEDIRGEHVTHGWFGWLLGYGRVRLDCRFIDDLWLPAVKNPYKLIKISHTARMKHPLIDYTAQDLQLNLDEIEERKKKATAKYKLKALSRGIISSFRKVA